MKRSRSYPPTVALPHTDLPAFVRRVTFMPDSTHSHELNVVCQDTGIVVYCTPHQTWCGQHQPATSTVAGVKAAFGRAEGFLRRHHFRWNVLTGYWQREVQP